MRKIIVKAIAKTSKASAKTNHTPLYKGITTTPTTAPMIVPVTVDGLHSYVMGIVCSTYRRAMLNFPISWEDATGKLYEAMKRTERILYAYSVDYWLYTMQVYFYGELLNNPYIHDDWKRFWLVSHLWENAVKNQDKNRPFYGRF